MKLRILALACAAAMIVTCSPGLGWAETRAGSMPPPAPAGAVSAAIVTDDDIPGVPLPASPFSDTLTSGGVDDWDVYNFNLDVGQEITFVLPKPPAGVDFDLVLYGPGTTSVLDPALQYLDTGNYPEAVQWTATVAGQYYLAVLNYAPGDDTYTVSWKIESAADSDNAPGVALPASPIIGNVDAVDADDVYKVFMRKGDTFTFTLHDPEYDITVAYDLYLYGPGTTDIYTDPYLAWTNTAAEPESIEWTADETGWYYLDVYSVSLDHAYTITWDAEFTPLLSVYRFYVPAKGTHFYTADLAEVARVQATLGSTYRLEGVGYVLNPLANAVPLHRFYNLRTGTHFYTADVAEKNNVQTNLSGTFKYDGPAYDVLLSPGGAQATTVWRFLNARTGTHFYTSDEAEKAYIQANLGSIYGLEGPAFYLGQ